MASLSGALWGIFEVLPGPGSEAASSSTANMTCFGLGFGFLVAGGWGGNGEADAAVAELSDPCATFFGHPRCLFVGELAVDALELRFLPLDGIGEQARSENFTEPEMGY